MINNKKTHSTLNNENYSNYSTHDNQNSTYYNSRNYNSTSTPPRVLNTNLVYLIGLSKELANRKVK